MMKTQKGKYSSVIATSTHQPVTDLTFFRRKWASPTMGFFFENKEIGYGDLARRIKKDHLHTDNVLLHEKFRRKGHGINLYIHLIETARKIGAKRVYSSTALNAFSGRMWREKLSKLYDVKTIYHRGACSECGGTKHKRPKYYYIKFKD